MADPRGPKASSNVYTVLAFLAFLMLGAAIAFVVMEAQELTGKSNPWSLIEPENAMATHPLDHLA